MQTTSVIISAIYTRRIAVMAKKYHEQTGYAVTLFFLCS
jgi:hypothetical protein